MSKYNILPAHLHSFADAAELILKTKFNLPTTKIEAPFDSRVGLSPTLLWKHSLGYVACEVSEKPLPVSILTSYAEIVASGIPIRLFVAYPSNQQITPAEYLRESNKAKSIGLGLLSVNDNNTGNIEHNGVDLSLYLAAPSLSSYYKPLRSEIDKAYGLYINGDPKHGVQDIGQIVESILVHVADQIKKKGGLQRSNFISKDIYYPAAKLIDDLIFERAMDIALLGRCRGFIDDRNGTSHKPKSFAESQKLHRALKNAMLDGLRILEKLPGDIKSKNYKLKFQI